MANKFRGEVKILLDKERKIKFTLNSLCELEDQAGIALSDLSEVKSVKAIRAILWAGLIDEDPSLTIEQVGKLITLDKIQEVSDSIREAFEGLQEKKSVS